MLRNLNERKSEKGFTLVELLIVVVILGALASTVVVASGGFKDKGVEQACRTTRSAIEIAAEGFHADSADGLYPDGWADIEPTYMKKSGGVTTATGSTDTVTLLKGKGWSFTVTFGATSGALNGSTTQPVVSAILPVSCAS